MNSTTSCPLISRSMRSCTGSFIDSISFQELVGVVVRAEKMQGDVGLVANHPAVVSWSNVEDVSRAHLSNGAIVHRSCRPARDDDADMLNRATRRANSRTDMERPSPAGFIGRAANRHATYPNNLELALFERSNFVGLLEPLHHYIHVLSHRLAVAICGSEASASPGSFPRHRAAGLCRKRSRRQRRRWATRKCRARPNAPCSLAAVP
jgi:hypothetical protein